MAKKKEKRLGSDPLNWIKNTESSDKPGLSDDNKSSKPDNIGKSDKPDKSGKQSKSDKQSNTNNIDKSDNQDKIDNTNKPDNNQEDWIRATFIIRREHAKRIKSLAYWERKNIKEVLDDALDLYLAKKDVKPIPKK